MLTRLARTVQVALLLAVAVGCSAPPRFDPVTMDPPPDAARPASMDGLRFESHGALLNGRIYEAAGAGPHPTLLMLHGFPGSELNLDIAQAVRRAGWNAVTFHYRGTWGSGGEFGVRHVLEDAAAVADAIREPAFAAAHRIDPARVSVFGHSMGGFAALVTGAERPALRCTVSVAGANFAAFATAAAADPRFAAQVAATFQGWGEGPIRDMSGERMVAELAAGAGFFDLAPRAAALAGRPLLLVAGERDTITPPALNHDPVLAMVRASGAGRLVELRLDAGHAFDDRRVALARGVLDFLRTNCS